MVPVPSPAVMVPPPQAPLRPFGVEMRRPPGNASVKPMPVSVETVFGLLIVNVSAAAPPMNENDVMPLKATAAPPLSEYDPESGPVGVTTRVSALAVPPTVMAVCAVVSPRSAVEPAPMAPTRASAPPATRDGSA